MGEVQTILVDKQYGYMSYLETTTETKVAEIIQNSPGQAGIGMALTSQNPRFWALGYERLCYIVRLQGFV